jgi:formamidopyrimidine-DNA glycosylase
LPELPEVETVVRSVRPHLVGQKILRVELSSRRVTRGDHVLTAQALSGNTVLAVRRQGKQILIDLDSGGLLYIHLGMTGKLLWNADTTRYTRAFFELSNGHLVYDDTRMFGRVEFYTSPPELVERVGPDALTVSFDQFFTRLKRYRGRIKAVLLNQTFISGVGNIYADEALFAAGINPKTSAARLSRTRAQKLHSHLLEILHTSIANRGSSISDYVDSAGARGTFQQLHNVYGKKDELCPCCSQPIRRIVIAQRGTHYCPRCQRV